MGNNQVCCGKNTNFDLDNNAETYIREQLMNLSNKYLVLKLLMKNYLQLL